MVLIAIWPVQKFENAVHLTGHKDSGTKQILREKWRPAGTGLRDKNSGIFLSRRDIWHVCNSNINQVFKYKGIMKLVRIWYIYMWLLYMICIDCTV